ncbi:MAG TPA: sulfatase, partial [Polyangia bacterium]|nr:sulfatase [Polyangia bacterium]
MQRAPVDDPGAWRYNRPMMKRTAFMALVPTLLVASLAASCGEPKAAEPPRPELPNVVLISIDTLRADRLGAWGYSRGTTPELDAFAREAVRFPNAIAQAPTTTPAHMSIFTGLLPAVHRMSNIHEDGPQSLDPSVTTFTELLRQAGYYTAGFHGGGNVDGSLGFERGFDFYSQDYISYNWMGAYHDPADLDAIRAWLRIARDRGKPLFLFLHHYVCHSPYVSAPDAFRDRFLDGRAVEGLSRGTGDDQKRRMIEMLDRRTGGQAKRLLHFRLFSETHDRFWKGVDLSRPDHRGHIEALYDAQVAYSDWLFGRVRKLLAEEGAYDDSLIVVLSDHGEEFGEHGGREHRQLFVETLHVPLLIRFPDGTGPRGSTVDRMVRTMDVMPTVFDTLKMPMEIPHQGVSFLPLVRGQGSYAPPLVSYADRDFNRLRLVRDGLIFTNQHTGSIEEWLFNAEKDPAEQKNLAGERPTDLAQMRNLGKTQRHAN